jgi:hypothetical protein
MRLLGGNLSALPKLNRLEIGATGRSSSVLASLLFSAVARCEVFPLGA